MHATLEQLLEQPLLNAFTEDELEEVLDLFHVERVEAGEVVFQQGETARNFYMVLAGQFEVLQEEEGHRRRLNLLYAGEFFGDVALIYDELRGATVRAVDDSEVLLLAGQDFVRLYEEFPRFARQVDGLGREIEGRTQLHFEGQRDDEVVLYRERRHPMALVRRLGKVAGLILLWFIVMGVAAFLFRTNEEAQARIAWVGLISMFLPVLWGLWEAYDWYNDLYIVTNERVIHIEEVVGMRYERFEAPLNKIQNVNVAHHNPISEALDYGKVIIATAAQGGASSMLILDYMPRANLIAERIIQELSKEREFLQQHGRAEKRRAIRAALGNDDSREAPVAPADDNAPTVPAATVQRPSITILTRSLLGYFRPRMREQRGATIIWRKHWLLLLRDSILAWTVFFLIVGGAGALAFLVEDSPLSLRWLGILTAILLLVNVGWLAWIYEDWRNDMYVLTPDAILDQEQNPLGFDKEVRRAPLETIQDMRYLQNNPVLVWFGIGHVMIQTAGQQGMFTFNWVRDPRGVQHDIFQYIQDRQRQREQNEAAAINHELLELLRVYDEERRAADDRRAPPPPPPSEAPTRRSRSERRDEGEERGRGGEGDRGRGGEGAQGRRGAGG